MPTRLVFLVTVADVTDFDRKIDTRRITRDCAAHWNETYGLSSIVAEVVCGPEFPSLNMFSRIFCVGDKDMVIKDAFEAGRWSTDQRRIWGLISTTNNFGLIIVNHKVTCAIVPHCVKMPDIAPNKLYVVVFRCDQKPEVLDTEGMAPSDFQALVEEAGARVATER